MAIKVFTFSSLRTAEVACAALAACLKNRSIKRAGATLFIQEDKDESFERDVFAAGLFCVGFCSGGQTALGFVRVGVEEWK